MSRYEIETVYLDMDGVISDFHSRVEELSGRKFHTMSQDEVWSYAILPNFFSDANPILNSHKLVEYLLDSYVDVIVLSSTGIDDDEELHRRTMDEKLEFLDKHFPKFDDVFFVRDGSHKCKYASPYSLLIDDRSKAVTPFIREGGSAILHRDIDETIEILGTLGI
jgi:hypothetical protein